ncbi:hypothetical protein D9M72_557380 [compost metagenome]
MLKETALVAPFTAQSGWSRASRRGATDASISPSFRRAAEPISFQRHPSLAAAWMSAAVSDEIPRHETSEGFSAAPSNSFARITTFSRTSYPSTSAVGSASAYPSACASCTACEKPSPVSMRPRTKFDVPFRTP